MRITDQIIDILEPHRRTVGEFNENTQDIGLDTVRQRIEAFATYKKPIHLVLPAFPCKSVSQQKVFGELPDMAEELSLKFLQGICQAISNIHAPGANLTICSDGRVFSPIVRVSDEAVGHYSTELNRITEHLGLASISFFHLENVFSGPKDKLRAELLGNFGKPIDELRKESLDNPSLMSTWIGITRFMFEEGKAWNEQQSIKCSNNRLQADSKARAWRVVQASQAWANLCDTHQFPKAVRLSIHPQGTESQKFGITLLPTQDRFLTPWHGVAVLKNNNARLVRRHELENLTGRVVMRHGRPSHFEEIPVDTVH